MPKFCQLRNKLNCIISSELNDQLLRIRFGVSSSGSTVTYDMYGEVEVNNTDYKNELVIYGIVEKSLITNDDESNIGGRPLTKRTQIEFITGLNTDILRNDVVEYPIGSNEFYRVNFKERASGNMYYIVKGVLEIRE